VDSALGVLFAGIAGASWAGYILLGKRFRNDAIGQDGLALGITVGALISMPFSLWEGQLDLLDAHTVLMGIVVAGLSSVIPYSLEFISLKNIPANIFGILMSIEPGIAAAIGLIFLGQAIDLPAGIAIGCVIVASIGATRTRPRKANPSR
jgi:inner membrane transporter RhtA